MPRPDHAPSRVPVNPWACDSDNTGCLSWFPLVTQKTLIQPDPGHGTDPDVDLLLLVEQKPGKEYLGRVRLRCVAEDSCSLLMEEADALYKSGQTSAVLRAIASFIFDSQTVERITLQMGLTGTDTKTLLAGISPATSDSSIMTLERDTFRKECALKTILVSAVALIDADNRVLLQKRPPGKAMAGLWEFPGGKVNPGETPEQALIRELYEELGIDIRPGCLAPLTFASHSYDDFHLLMPLYACRQWTGTPHGREGQELAWVSRQKLRTYPMPDADIPLVPILDMWL